MRVLFTTQPGLGHLLPLLPVAEGLRGRGHDVAFATSASFAPEIAAAGFAAHAVGRDWLTVDMARAFPAMAAVPPGPERYAWARRDVFAGATAGAAVADLVRLGRSWAPHLVVREAAEYGGCLAAEVLGLPHAVIRTDSGSSSSGERHHVAAALSRHRAHVGLPPDPDVEMPFRHLLLSFAPPALDGDARDRAPTYQAVQPDGETGRADQAPAWLDRLPRRPTVYATLGTVYNGTDSLRVIVEALASEPVNVVVTTGPNRDPAELGAPPANVRVARWIPQRPLLARCAAVVTHGGSGTVAAALAAGLPLVLLPISADQPLNAKRCADAGVGCVVPPDRRTPAAIRVATRAVLADPHYRLAARRQARAVRRRPRFGHALELLERLGGHR